MGNALLLAPVILVLGTYLLALGLCRAAARGDRMARHYRATGARHGLDAPLHRKGRP